LKVNAKLEYVLIN